METRSLRCTICDRMIHTLLVFLPCIDPGWLSFKRRSNIVCACRLIAIFFIMFSLASFLATNREIFSYESSPGRVTHLLARDEAICITSDTTPISPECSEETYIVRFQTKEGRWIETTFIAAGRSSLPRPGDRILVGYDPHDPKGTAMDYGALRWSSIFSWIIAMLGICFLLLDWAWRKFLQKVRRWKKLDNKVQA